MKSPELPIQNQQLPEPAIQEQLDRPLFVEPSEPIPVSQRQILAEARAIKAGINEHGNKYWLLPENRANRKHLEARNKDILADHPYAEFWNDQAVIGPEGNQQIIDAKSAHEQSTEAGDVHAMGSLDFSQLATTFRAVDSYGGDIIKEFPSAFSQDKLQKATRLLRAVIAKRGEDHDPINIHETLANTSHDDLPELIAEFMPTPHLVGKAGEEINDTRSIDDTQSHQLKNEAQQKFATRLKYLWADVVDERASSDYFRTDTVDSPTFMMAALALAKMKEAAAEKAERTAADEALDALYYGLQKTGESTVLEEPETHFTLELTKGVGSAAVKLTAETQDHTQVLISA